MAWPTTLVSTANLDEGTDNPSWARADLKTAIDHLNAMTSELPGADFSSAENGQTLVYRNGTWAPENLYANTYSCYLRFNNFGMSPGSSAVTGDNYFTPTIIDSSATGATISGTEILVSGGTYLFETVNGFVRGEIGNAESYSGEIKLKNNTTNAILCTFAYSVGYMQVIGPFKTTLVGDTSLSLVLADATEYAKVNSTMASLKITRII